MEIQRKLENLYHEVASRFEGKILQDDYTGYIKIIEKDTQWHTNLTFKNNIDLDNERMMCYMLSDIANHTDMLQPQVGGTYRTSWGNAELYFRFWGDDSLEHRIQREIKTIKDYARKKLRECHEDVKYYKDNSHKPKDRVNRITQPTERMHGWQD